MQNIKKISEVKWEIEKAGAMQVPGIIFASEKLLADMKKDITIKQIQNVAKLPGIIKASIAMPDAHQGYGFPIGGVAAFDLNKGIISPGGVGYDINCGVRILATNIPVKDFQPKLKTILHDFKRTIPSGVGRGHKERLSDEDLDEVLTKGAEWAVENNYGTRDDLEVCEEYGKISPANPADVSQRAKARGKPQLGTLGAGNHFIEIQKVENILDQKTAQTFQIEKDTIVIMIHCGSRGLGHQVASDYIKLMEQNTDISKLPDRELVHAPISSQLGQKYISAMNCAINFAFCNRQMIMHHIRQIIKRHFPKNKNHLIYDVCHNVAKFEDHIVNRKKQNVCVHRKGATRAFGPGRKEIPLIYKKIGQPVIIPGSMGTASYLLVGTKKAEEQSWGSTAHGAGRVMSRSQAIRTLNPEQIKSELKQKGIEIEAGSPKGISEEAPQAYKDVDEVVRVSDQTGITKIIAKLRPLGVVKG
ncbi:RNA-splicing ligase RtcB [Candidatus Pacearchaeota archaeon]|nr:RNA-splicing ligase RtcB [Candidatus Pacearchaeota archaeon]